jgi:hypothetical protein
VQLDRSWHRNGTCSAINACILQVDRPMTCTSQNPDLGDQRDHRVQLMVNLYELPCLCFISFHCVRFYGSPHIANPPTGRFFTLRDVIILRPTADQSCVMLLHWSQSAEKPVQYFFSRKTVKLYKARRNQHIIKLSSILVADFNEATILAFKLCVRVQQI